MMLRALALVTSLVLWSGSGFAATTFQILGTTTSNGSPLDALDVGETLTVSLRIIDGVGVFGLGASAWNYNEAVIDFQSGTTVASINHAVCVPSTGCFSGLTNSIVTAGATGPVSESSIGVSGNRVLIFNGVGLGATNYSTQDPGIDGVISGLGAQVSIVFVAIANGTSTIRFGTGYNGDGEVLAGGDTNQNANTDLVISVPEPATLAAGMAALASVAGVVAVRRRF